MRGEDRPICRLSLGFTRLWSRYFLSNEIYRPSKTVVYSLPCWMGKTEALILICNKYSFPFV